MRRRVAVYGLAVAKSGFTLTEILVAVTILAITVAAIYTSFKGGLTSWTKGTIRMERYQNARAALEMMSREISAAIIIAADGSYQIDFYGVDNTETVSGETVDDDYLCFVAPVREDPDEPDLRKVRYELDETNRQLRRGTDDSIDGDITSDFSFAQLALNVKSLNFQYYDSSWLDSWDSRDTSAESGTNASTEDSLPTAVKITITVQDELKQEEEQTFSATVYLPATG
ncbi:prepilin-type N-terminal cleavage/methylation domain-containing protein [bacterium]|nr:prepilin-type N-terminal cleavage/methylation domain-containing protein [bacterium]